MLFVKKLDPRAKMPTVGHPNEDLAFDLYALEDCYVHTGITNKIRTGIAARFETVETNGVKPYKYGLLVRDRSSMAIKGLAIVAGVIDHGYTDEIAILMNFNNNIGDGHPLKISAGQKIAQIIPLEVHTSARIEEVDEFSTTSSRGTGGFGSTGF